MSATLKAIKVWGKGGPNPPKVAMILSELGLPNEIIDFPIKDVKSPEYVAINPNGRLPAIHDPNTDLTLWESGAIVEYLVEKYDTEHRISFPAGSNEAYLCKQWLYFQTTGQGPYFGQNVFFRRYHSEQLPSAIERFVKEVNRVTGVLESWLEKQAAEHPGTDGPWLVGGRITYADIAFYAWQQLTGNPQLTPKEDYNVDNYPRVKEWLAKIRARPQVQEALKDIPMFN